MDICEYCGIEYHPMTVWTKPGSRIHVCDPEMRKLMATWGIPYNEEALTGQDRARLDNYIMRRDLTPRR